TSTPRSSTNAQSRRPLKPASKCFRRTTSPRASCWQSTSPQERSLKNSCCGRVKRGKSQISNPQITNKLKTIQIQIGRSYLRAGFSFLTFDLLLLFGIWEFENWNFTPQLAKKTPIEIPHHAPKNDPMPDNDLPLKYLTPPHWAHLVLSHPLELL